MRHLYLCMNFICCLGLLAGEAAADKRQAIAACWKSGAANQWLMQQCSGLSVSTPEFHSCMSGGFCLGEPPVVSVVPPGVPFCGALGLPFCPMASPCGYPGTISCPSLPGFHPQPFITALGCGALPFPACAAPQPCGLPTTFLCAGQFSSIPAYQAAMFGWQPSLQIALPAPQDRNEGFGIKTVLAMPPIPEAVTLSECRDESSDEEEMYQCIRERALPPAYRTTVHCMEEHPKDNGAALICSTGREDLKEAYRKMTKVQKCAEEYRNDTDIAVCAGEQFLGHNERYYLQCVKDNVDAYGAAVACGLAKNLTPEQQIALSCAVKTGGNPKAFLVCTGGRLLAREIDKCWKHGIATQDGCFGPNNDLRKFADGIDERMKKTLGKNSEVYKAYKLYKDVVLLPGANHEGVKAFNTVLNDIQNGPGENNDIIKAGNELKKLIPSVSISIPRMPSW